jgi:5-formyltetrahydrofolate cyclo-ligase
MRRLRHGQPGESQAVCETLARLLADRPAWRTIATFSPIRGEVDLSPLADRLPDRHWLYPRVSGDDLTFHLVCDPERDLIPGAFGILEPPPALPVIAHGLIDAFLCPGLAFDPRGGRLGRGRGFYDRTLSLARPNAAKIGVCFPDQLVPDTFPEDHDIHMDEVVWGNIER